MDRDDRNTASQTPDSDRSSDPVDERLLDERQSSQEDIVDAARQSFNQDQNDPDHPSRVERRAGDVEDPSHSKGSQA